MALTKYKLGYLIEPCDERNYDGIYTLDDIKGISTGKEFIDTKANMDGVSLSSYKVVKNQEFAYVADTSRRGEKIAIAFNDAGKAVLISSIYTVFRVSKSNLLSSDYLFMYFNRPEFDRYARFNSWGSARETFDWDTMCDIDIELPDLNGQKQRLSNMDAKVVLLYFWSASQPSQNVFNVEVLKPVYEDYHSKGFDIYQVSLDVDKSLWATTVKGQELPWEPFGDTAAQTAFEAVFIYNNIRYAYGYTFDSCLQAGFVPLFA